MNSTATFSAIFGGKHVDLKWPLSSDTAARAAFTAARIRPTNERRWNSAATGEPLVGATVTRAAWLKIVGECRNENPD